MCWDSCKESESGNTDKRPSSTEPADLLDLTRPEDWVTRPSKVSSSTVSELDVVTERDLCQRVPPTVSQPTKVLTNWSTKEPWEPPPKKESAVVLPTWESWTPTGSTKTPPTSTSKSSWSILPTRPSEEMLVTTGSVTQFTSTVRPEVWLPLVRSPEVSTRVTSSTTPKPVEERPGRDKTLCLCGDTENKRAADPSYCVFSLYTTVLVRNFFIQFSIFFWPAAAAALFWALPSISTTISRGCRFPHSYIHVFHHLAHLFNVHVGAIFVHQFWLLVRSTLFVHRNSTNNDSCLIKGGKRKTKKIFHYHHNINWVRLIT